MPFFRGDYVAWSGHRRRPPARRIPPLITKRTDSSSRCNHLVGAQDSELRRITLGDFTTKLQGPGIGGEQADHYRLRLVFATQAESWTG
jgi:hypothetical protein